MTADLHSTLLQAVSPFEQGVAGLRIDASRQPRGRRTRPNRTAAVLVPVLERAVPEVILTVRSDQLEQHPGQVSFPGGQVDRGDRSAVSTALREAREEIGLRACDVSPLGFLDRLDTVSDFRVLPVVGLVRASFRWRPDQREVVEVFTVPLDVAIDRERYERHELQRGEHRFVVYSLDWQSHTVWGVTAAILLNLGERMRSGAAGAEAPVRP
ncbi:MAG: CoA pyrophosphatase [Lysobacterales bacterium]|jgi:8-oxo-dGTP pyrophosphatase MutT (NUDIX family)